MIVSAKNMSIQKVYSQKRHGRVLRSAVVSAAAMLTLGTVTLTMSEASFAQAQSTPGMHVAAVEAGKSVTEATKPSIKDAAKYATTSITVAGLVETPLVLDVAALGKFPVQQIGDVQLICQSGADRGKLDGITGTRLRDILEKAKIKAPAHNDVKKMVIVATASDGYKAVFSWNELFNSPIGDGVVVFYAKGGLPLEESEGRIAMVSTQDTRTGPRHVRWLQRIDVIKVGETKI
ncbi:predicted oxidoreductase, molybdopterin binding [gamma proteobacterium HdN1]|nr:predicted oxidoreductase, molybdopterin binding [gamma proteobacterium HdN1]